MFVTDPGLTSNEKGAIAEAHVTAEAIRLGFVVLRPSTEGRRYDIVVDTGARLWRVQCKWARLEEGVIKAQVGTCYHSPTRGYVRTRYRAREVDALALYCAPLSACLLVPIEDVDGRTTLHLRVEPPLNGQLAGVSWASQYEFGAVAQLEERCHGMAEVRGSSPLSSTPADVTVGAHEFRNRFGWYLERAAAGETINVTRRGSPHVVLAPPAALVRPIRSDAA